MPNTNDHALNHYNIRPNTIFIAVLFSAFLILSNLTAFKLTYYKHLIFPAGLVFFPVTYLFGDILTEVYGFKVSRRIIWSAMTANMIVIGGTLLTVYLPPASLWHQQKAYASVYHAATRVFIASTIGYLCGEFINAIILAKLKVWNQGRHLWFRALVSTATGVGIDTIIFVHIAFALTMPYNKLWSLITTMYALKLGWEIIAIPITYKVTHYLKHHDAIDYYDKETQFNPFSLRVD